MLIEALLPDQAVEGLDVGVIRRFSGPAEVERYAVGIRPKVQGP